MVDVAGAGHEVQMLLTGEAALLDAKGDRERYHACERASVARNPRPGCGKSESRSFLEALAARARGVTETDLNLVDTEPSRVLRFHPVCAVWQPNSFRLLSVL